MAWKLSLILTVVLKPPTSSPESATVTRSLCTIPGKTPIPLCVCTCWYHFFQSHKQECTRHTVWKFVSSLNNVSLRPFQVSAQRGFLFFHGLSYYTVWFFRNWVNHSPPNWLLGCFQSFTVLSNAAGSDTCESLPVRYIPRSGITNQSYNCFFFLNLIDIVNSSLQSF